MSTLLPHGCIGCGLHLDDCECDADLHDDDCECGGCRDRDEPDGDGSPGWWTGDACRRCGGGHPRGKPCTCPYLCDHSEHGTTAWRLRREWYDRDTDAGAATLRLCGRCAEAERRSIAPRAFYHARFCGGTPRQRRLRRLHRHQRRCSECGRRRCRPDSVCIPF